MTGYPEVVLVYQVETPGHTFRWNEETYGFELKPTMVSFRDAIAILTGDEAKAATVPGLSDLYINGKRYGIRKLDVVTDFWKGVAYYHMDVWPIWTPEKGEP